MLLLLLWCWCDGDDDGGYTHLNDYVDNDFQLSFHFLIFLTLTLPFGWFFCGMDGWMDRFAVIPHGLLSIRQLLKVMLY